MESPISHSPNHTIDTRFTVRPFDAEEWPLIKTIRLEALRAPPDVYFSAYADTVTQPDSYWQQLVDRDGKCAFGLFDADQLIGMCAVFTSRDDPTGQTGMMAAGYIQPEYRGKGLSRLLFQARIEWALAHTPWTKLVISHRAGNEPSRRANQAFGFRPTGREVIRWPDGTDAEEWNYALDLDALRASGA